MHRLTLAGAGAVLAGSAGVAVTLVSVALAATAVSEPRPAAPPASGPSDDDLDAAYGLALPAAAAALGFPADELAARLAGGASLKEVADAREVGYGTLARAVNDAASPAVGTRAGIAALVAAWIDAGGQPDARLLPANRGGSWKIRFLH